MYQTSDFTKIISKIYPMSVRLATCETCYSVLHVSMSAHFSENFRMNVVERIKLGMRQ
jgi:hypothetical protein